MGHPIAVLAHQLAGAGEISLEKDGTGLKNSLLYGDNLSIMHKRMAGCLHVLSLRHCIPSAVLAGTPQTFINRARTSVGVVRGYTLLAENLRAFALAPVLPFDAAAAAVFDDLRAQGVRIATMDLRIASIALCRGLIVLTRNTRDFGKVPGLVTEDWTL